MIPTPGRVVWFYPGDKEQAEGWNLPPKGQPLAAVIAGVLANDLVNLSVTDFNGLQYSRQAVTMMPDAVTEDIIKVSTIAFASWMPYQVQQAKKAETMSKDVCEAKTSEVQSSPSLRQHCLELAARTNLEATSLSSYVALAQEFEDYILGTKKENPNGTS